MDQFSALNAFCRVVEAGGFSAAAAELNVSHTLMSKQVRQLEARLGAQLLNRTTRRLALTDAGQAYYQRARRILDDLQEADLAQGRLLLAYPIRARDLYAVYPQNRHLSPKVRAFIDFAAEIYRAPGWA